MGLKYKLHKAFMEGHIITRALHRMFENIDDNWGDRYRCKYVNKIKQVPNQVFFNSFQGNYTCNPKYICEELIRRKADVKIVWGLKNPESLPNFGEDVDCKAYKLNTIEYYEAALHSKVIITNGILGARFATLPVGKNQVAIETWHGSLGLKRIDEDSYKTTKDWPKAMRRTGKRTTYCMTNSDFEDMVFRTSFWKKTPMLKFGHARNDIFFNNEEKREKLFNKMARKFGVQYEKDVHFVIYGPTFRDDHNFQVYDLDFDKVLDAFEKRFGGKWYLLLRYHPTVLVDSGFKNSIKSARVFNVSNYLDMQELLLISDAGISDYSSWMFDYMLTRKPIFIFALDYAKYKDERGFYYPISTTPFPIGETNDQLAEHILNFNNEEYVKKVEEFLKDKGCVEDGQAAKRIVDLILGVIEKGKQEQAKK